MTLSRRRFMQTAAAFSTIALSSRLDPASARMPAVSAVSSVPYSADSFFRSRVIGAPVDAAATAAFQSFMKSHPDQKGTPYPKINGITASNQWGISFHLGTSSDPVWRLTGGGVKSGTQIAATQGFHMADSVALRFPSGSQDRPGLINDPVFGYSVLVANGVPNKANRTISCSASSVFWHSSNGLDGKNPRSNDRRNACSRGRIPDAMVVRGDLVRSAAAANTSLGHVLQMFFVETNSASGFCHPMTGAESGKSGWGAQGVRIAVKPTIDLVARGFSGGALVVARTLQQHGAYLGDNSGSSSMLKGEQATSSYLPYAGTNITSTCLSRLTWADFVVLPKGWQG